MTAYNIAGVPKCRANPSKEKEGVGEWVDKALRFMLFAKFA